VQVLTTKHKTQASIDECFVDFSAPARALLLERFPYLGQVPEDAPNGLDTPLPVVPPNAITWDELGTVIPVHPVADGDTAMEVDPSSPAGSSKLIEPEPTWHDVALSIAAELMAKVRKAVREKLGYTMTAVRPTMRTSYVGV